MKRAAFRLQPVTDSDYLVREVTARCVDRITGATSETAPAKTP